MSKGHKKIFVSESRQCLDRLRHLAVAQDRAVELCVRSFLDIKVAPERRGLVGSALAFASDRVRF